MCGIVGVVSRDFSARIDEQRIIRMRDVLAHRGPDGAGVWMHGPVAFGHRRLSIVDVANGAQPMSNEDGQVWLTFNGEIYNHADLRSGLIARGHRYRTRSDTETILHLYEEKGARAVETLHGMFAFAIWDAARNQLLLARDRLGIKPLYYAMTERELLFASEIKAILAVWNQRVEMNPAAVPELLATRFLSGEDTLFRGIRRLAPGHTLTWAPGDRMVSRRYWQMPLAAGEPASAFAEAADDLRQRLIQSVRRHLMSDVPLGVFVSGGLDSSALAGLAATIIKEPLRTFAVGFAEAEANELPYARAVARQIGSRHHEMLVSPEDYFDSLPQLIWQEDEPIAFTSSVPLYFVSQLASRHVKVVLTGEGADELFLGYNRYRVTYWNEKLGAPYFAVTSGRLREQVRSLVGRLPARLRRWSLRSFLGLEPGLRSLYFDNFALFPDRLREPLLAMAAPGRDPFAEGLRYVASGPGTVLDRMSRADLHTYLHELLMKQDQMSMAASIESRVPFLDDALIEHVVAMPASLKVRGWRTKAVLREAVRDLVPPEVLTRKKIGFPVPIGGWFRGRFWPVVEEFVLGPRARARGHFDPCAVRRLAGEHRAGVVDHGDRLWLLINFEIWHRIFREGEAPGDIMRPIRRAAA